MIVTRALTNLRLDPNAAKAARLDRLGDEYMFVLQCYCRHLFGEVTGGGTIDKMRKNLPPLLTPLSERWKRCAWRQACGVMRSWFSNGRDRDDSDEPSFPGVTIQASVNVVTAQKAVNATRFGWWLRVSTLAKGEVQRVPFDLHPYAEKVLAEAVASGGKLCGDVLIRRAGPHAPWEAQLATRTRVTARKTRGVRGADAGIATIVSDSAGNRVGTLSGKLTGRVRATRDRMTRKQKLNACLIKKGRDPVSLRDGRTERFVRNEIGRAVKAWVRALAAEETPPRVVLECLDVAGMRMKSREGNLLLRAAQLGEMGRIIRSQLDLAGIPWEEINPAYSSQQCRVCGFTLRENRPSQARFLCLACGHAENADTHAAHVIAGRSGDDALNTAPWRQVRSILAERFMKRWGGRLPAGPGLDEARAGTVRSGPPGGDLFGRFDLSRLGRGSPSGVPDGPLGTLKPGADDLSIS